MAAILLSMAPGALAAAVDFKGLTFSSFKLKGSNGYEVEVIFAREGKVPVKAAITADHRELSANYVVPPEPGPGLRATFGSVGAISVGFHRKQRSVEEFGKNCTVITEVGVFRGRFSFNGEGDYTSAGTNSARGEVLSLPDGFCFFDDEARASSIPDFLRTTTLVARSRTANGSIEVSASALKVLGNQFGLTASLREKVGPMEITRTASVKPRKGILQLGPGKPPRSADLRPPWPFEGTAHFEDPAAGPPTWTGTLSVSLPGAPALALTGPSFLTRICVERSILGSCQVKLPPGPGKPQPEL